MDRPFMKGCRRLGCVVALLGAFCGSAVAQIIETPATHAVIMDYETGEVLFEKNGAAPMIPASMTKMMTVYTVLDRVKRGEIALTDKFTVSEDAWRRGGWNSGGSTMGLGVGDTPTVEELLRGVIVLSGNDACIVLAEGLAGSEPAFAREMTALAREIGLETASFTNTTGLDGPEHRVSAIDLAELAARKIRYFPEFYEIYAVGEYEWRGIKQSNRNPLLGTMAGVDGLKTGHLSVSGYGLTASGVRDGTRRIIVINGLESANARAREAERMMRTAYSAFDIKTLTADGLDLPALDVWMGDAPTVPVTFEGGITVSGHKRAMEKAAVRIEYDGPIEAPVVAGTTLADLVIEVEGKAPVRMPLTAEEDVPAVGFVGRALEGLRLMIEGG
ncbi:MAG: D-alanyl-D-alanine carboxypeptidase family protein [Pseudomonadota bacterium]